MSISFIIKRSIDVLMPQICPVCGTNKVSYPFPVCRQCKDIAINREKPVITPSLYLEMILSCRPYKDAVRTCLKELKYYDNSNVLPFFKELIADFLKTDSGGFGNIDLLLSVPSYSAQYASRKTDHSRTIASIVSELTGIPVGHKILVKTRKTHQQARLPRQTRLTNLRNCFSVVDPLFVKGKHLLIVDDIITTGTTMNECAKALKRAGAFKLSGLTIAKTY